MATGWPIKLADVFGRRRERPGRRSLWGERYNLCGFLLAGDVEWVASDVSRLLEATMPVEHLNQVFPRINFQ